MQAGFQSTLRQGVSHIRQGVSHSRQGVSHSKQGVSDSSMEDRSRWGLYTLHEHASQGITFAAHRNGGDSLHTILKVTHRTR